MKKILARWKIVFVISVALVSVFALCAVAFCSDADISASADVQEITIGDSINYRVLITLPQEAKIKDPFAAQGKLGDFEIRDFKWSVEQDTTQRFILEYTLSIFQAGSNAIPEYKVEYRGSPKEQWQPLIAKEIEITTKSVLGDDKEQELKPLKPKVIVWRDFLPWIIGIVVIAGALWAAFKFWKRKQKVSNKHVVVEAAHIIAYRELEQIEGENLISRGLMEKYYEKLSGCIRRYLENRFFLRAPWMSTEEFLREVKASPVLNTHQRAALKDFLLLSDLVKFARYGSSGKEAAETFAGARSFVDQTKLEESKEEKPKT